MFAVLADSMCVIRMTGPADEMDGWLVVWRIVEVTAGYLESSRAQLNSGIRSVRITKINSLAEAAILL